MEGGDSGARVKIQKRLFQEMLTVGQSIIPSHSTVVYTKHGPLFIDHKKERKQKRNEELMDNCLLFFCLLFFCLLFLFVVFPFFFHFS